MRGQDLLGLRCSGRLLEQGLISPLHSRAVTDAVLGLDEPVAAKVESRVLQRAPEQALSNFTASLKRAVLALAPPKTVEEAQHEAMQDRRVVVTPLADGMAQLWALLPAGGAAAVMTAVNALADRVQPDDPRCVEQRRADALVQTGIDVLTGQNLRRAAADLKWTSPTGHVYVKPAATYPIDRATTVAAQASSVDPDPPPF